MLYEELESKVKANQTEIENIRTNMKKDLVEALKPLLVQNNVSHISWLQGRLYRDGEERIFSLRSMYVNVFYDRRVFLYLEESWEMNLQEFLSEYKGRTYPLSEESFYQIQDIFHLYSEKVLAFLFGQEPKRISILDNGLCLEKYSED